MFNQVINLKDEQMISESEVMIFPPGIKWMCLRCAMCCSDTPDHERKIMMLEEEAVAISKATGLKIDKFTRQLKTSYYSREMLKKEGKCLFLKDNICEIYNNRPLICNFYPFGLNKLNSQFTFLLTEESCKGLGKGKVLEENFYKQLLAYAKNKIKE